MKNVFLALMLLVGITTFAQEGKPKREKLTSEEKVDFQVKRMTTDLSLNEKQVADVRAIVTKQVAKREAKKAEVTQQKEKKRQEMKAEFQKEQATLAADMKKVLTPEQFTKWEKSRQEKKGKLKERMSERRGKGKIDTPAEDK